MDTKLPMKAHEGNMEPWFIEHGLSVTDEQRDILRGIVRERDRLREVNAELLAALESLANAAAWHSNVKQGTPDLDGSKMRAALVSARAAIAKAKG